ncbi:MAG TPA: hypothetical protein VFO69_03735 [Allosphingosinicella sp.]|nr:hypothetical protein [Allosphingosinicella sp.]
MTKFLINKGGVYYLTTGRLLTYDSNATDNPADPPEIRAKKKAGVKEAKETFDRIRNAPHTFYEAVEIDIAGFGPMNTGQVT